MKVLLVSPKFFPKPGGVESYLIELIRNLRDIEFGVLTNWRPDEHRARSLFPNVAFHYVWPAERALRKWFARFDLTMRPYRVLNAGIELLRTVNRRHWLRRIDADVVHFQYLDTDQLDRFEGRFGLHSLITRRYHRLTAAARNRAGILFTDHTIFTSDPGIVPLEAKTALLAAFENIVSVDTQSFDVVQAYQKQHGGRSWLIPNSVDTEIFHEGGQSHEGFRVGFAGRVGKKGESLLNAVVKKLRSEVAWNFALGGDEFDIKRTGFVSSTPGSNLRTNLDYLDMPSFYSSIDVLVNPYPGEGIGRTTLEAMACGVPVVGVGTGDKYPILNGETGYLVAPEPTAITDAILALKHRPDLLSSMSKRARAVIEKEFSTAVVLPKIRAVYETVSKAR